MLAGLIRKLFFYSLITFPLIANTHANICYRPVLSLSGGIASTNDAGKSQTLPVIDSSTYSYSADHSWKNHFIFGGFAGAEMAVTSYFDIQAGLSYYQTYFNAKGNLTQGADAQSSDTYGYRFGILARQLLLEAKFLYSCYGIYHPYLSVGLGGSFNNAKNYSTNVPPFLTFTPVFSDHTESSFSYNAGLGVDVDVYQNLRLGIGYRFADFGKVSLGNGMIDTVSTDSKLSQSHFYVNELLAQITLLLN